MEDREPYPTDLTDAQWQCLREYLPEPSDVGRPQEYEQREIINTILYVLHTGCQWEMVPNDLVPGKTAYYHFSKWRDDGTWEEISQQLGQLERKNAGRHPKPTASIADSQSVPSSTKGPERGYDAGKRTDGRKRHLLVDTMGLLMAVLVTGADMHDADAAQTLMDNHRDALERVELIWGDSKYGQKQLPDWASEELDAEIEVKQRPNDADGFEVIERRWVVERTNAWNMNDRRLQRDVEVLPESSEAMIHLSQINRLLNRFSDSTSV